ncbi:MAG: FixH family protein [Bacteroidota bacterium]
MNWGTKLTVGMALFMGFIVVLVTLMIKPHQADSLIDTDYYEKGQTYDVDYNARLDARKDSMLPSIKPGENDLRISFPKAASYKISLRRLSDARLDKFYTSNIAIKEVIILPDELPSGSWLLRIEYSREKRNYLYQDKILMP